MAYTTIQIKEETREKLGKLKAYDRETYDEVLNTLIELIPSGDDEGEYTEEFRASLLRGLGDITHGRTHSSADIRKKLGISS